MIDETVWERIYRVTAHYVKKIESGSIFVGYCTSGVKKFNTPGVLISKREFIQADLDLLVLFNHPSMYVWMLSINLTNFPFMFVKVISSTTDMERICYLQSYLQLYWYSLQTTSDIQPLFLSLSHYNHVFLVDDDRRQSEKGAEYDLPNESFRQQYLLSLFHLPNLKRL